MKYKFFENIYRLWIAARKSRFVNRNNMNDRGLRWSNLFEWSQQVGYFQREINRISKHMGQQ